VSSPPASRWIVLGVVGLAQFMVLLDATIVNIALPSIQRSLHLSISSLQWVVNAYTLAFGGFLLLGGRVADLLGRRRSLMAALAVFLVSSLVNGLAESAVVLVAGRGLQGLSAAFIAPTTLSIIVTTFTEESERTKALAVWSAIAAAGGGFGLLLGGVLTYALSWHWIFLINVPLSAIAVAATRRWLSESRGSLSERRFDTLGAALATAGLVVLVYAIDKTQSFGWLSLRTLALALLAVALLASFAAVERRARAPLVRLQMLRARPLAGVNAIAMLVVSGAFATFLFASIYAQEVLGYSPLKTGLAFLPITAGILVGSGMSQAVLPRVGVRRAGVGGLILALVGMVLLTRITVHGEYTLNLLIGLFPLALGLGVALVPITMLATSGVEADEAGLASGLYNTAQQVGGALGLALLSTLAAERTASALATHGNDHTVALVLGLRVAITVGALLIGAGTVLLALLPLSPSDAPALAEREAA
jgi:EmrB/QacA subfamily drug resistance transporter